MRQVVTGFAVPRTAIYSVHMAAMRAPARSNALHSRTRANTFRHCFFIVIGRAFTVTAPEALMALLQRIVGWLDHGVIIPPNMARGPACLRRTLHFQETSAGL